MLYLLISFSFGNNAPTNALGREVFPNTPKSDASLPDTASKALLRQIDEACEKREEGKTNADYGANRAGTVGKRSWGEETLGGGGRGRKSRSGLRLAWGLGRGCL